MAKPEDAERIDFNPRPPRGGRPDDFCGDAHIVEFQSTPSARRATFGKSAFTKSFEISIHALREEGDRLAHVVGKGDRIFQSTPSARRATGIHGVSSTSPIFQSTPSARRATTVTDKVAKPSYISIHALREEGDSKSGEKIHHVCSIIHTCAQFEKELYEGSGEMQNKSC